MGIVKYMDEWIFSGIKIVSDKNKDDLNNNRKIYMSEQQQFIEFKENYHDISKAMLEIYMQVFNVFSGGNQIVFIHEHHFNDFITRFKELFSRVSQSSPKKQKKILKKYQNQNNFEFIPAKDARCNDVFVIFANPKYGIEVIRNIIHAFPDENNPYYLEDLSDDYVELAICRRDCSPEIVYYMIDNYKDKLHFFKDGEIGTQLLSDLDFILRFYKHIFYTNFLSFCKFTLLNRLERSF